MGHSPRVDAPGAWHHVMNRGAGRRVTFRDDVEREVFVSLVAELDDRFGVEIHAYCLMDNHYHLLVRSRSGRLSESMAWLSSLYTRSVNDRREVDGAIFRGRFHSVLVQRHSHLDWLFRYINANPLDRGWTAPLAAYPWSGLAASLHRGGCGGWLHTEYVNERFGDDPQRLERFVERSRGDRNHQSIGPELGVDEDEIADAVALARAPGPHVNSNAEVRAVRTHVLSTMGVPTTGISTVGHLDEKSAGQYLARARERCERDGPTRQLFGRTISVLVIANNARPPHSVSDTE